MPDWDTVRELAGALPAAEESTTYGQPAFKVSGKLFVWMSPHPDALGALAFRVDPRREGARPRVGRGRLLHRPALRRLPGGSRPTRPHRPGGAPRADRGRLASARAEEARRRLRGLEDAWMPYAPGQRSLYGSHPRSCHGNSDRRASRSFAERPRLVEHAAGGRQPRRHDLRADGGRRRGAGRPARARLRAPRRHQRRWVVALDCALRRPELTRTIIVGGTTRRTTAFAHCGDARSRCAREGGARGAAESGAPRPGQAGLWKGSCGRSSRTTSSPTWTEDDLRRITGPALLVASEDDPFATLDQMATMKREIPRGRVADRQPRRARGSPRASRARRPTDPRLPRAARLSEYEAAPATAVRPRRSRVVSSGSRGSRAAPSRLAGGRRAERAASRGRGPRSRART